MQVDWEFEHAVEVDAPAAAGWRFWTQVENWVIDPSVEWARLEGVFETGAEGETKQKGFPPLRWKIVEARAPERGVIEVKISGATARFALDFEPVSERASLLRQRITLGGPDAARLSANLGSEFEEGVRQGMKKLADAIARDAEKEER
jgi:hypothetical protein